MLRNMFYSVSFGEWVSGVCGWVWGQYVFACSSVEQGNDRLAENKLFEYKTLLVLLI